MTTEEKNSLIAKAQREYPEFEVFYSAISTIKSVSTGEFYISENGDVLTTAGRAVYNGRSREWADKIKKGN